jgi:serine/threonine protein kinase
MEYKIGTKVFGDWEIVKELGHGASGTVFELEKNDFHIKTKSALKVITVPASPSDVEYVMSEGMSSQSVTSYFEGFVDEIVKEIAVMSDLKNHPNIVRYEDHMVRRHDQGIGWDILIRMELLTPVINYQKYQPIDELMVLKMGKELAGVLAYCHSKKLIHRDVKPQNVFVDSLGRFRLGDFGVARTIEKTTGGLSKKGTESYMAPEVYLGKTYGANVDLYSLGLMLYQYLNNNRLPFLPTDRDITFTDRENAISRRMRGEAIPPPVNGTDGFHKVILKACAFQAKDRYHTAGEMLRDLEGAALGTWNAVGNYGTASDMPEEEPVGMFDDAPEEETVGMFDDIPEEETIDMSDSVPPKKNASSEQKTTTSSKPGNQKEISVVPGSKTGTQICIEGKGVPSLHNKNQCGNHYVTLHVEAGGKKKNIVGTVVKTLIIIGAVYLIGGQIGKMIGADWNKDSTANSSSSSADLETKDLDTQINDPVDTTEGLDANVNAWQAVFDKTDSWNMSVGTINYETSSIEEIQKYWIEQGCTVEVYSGDDSRSVDVENENWPGYAMEVRDWESGNRDIEFYDIMWSKEEAERASYPCEPDTMSIHVDMSEDEVWSILGISQDMVDAVKNSENSLLEVNEKSYVAIGENESASYRSIELAHLNGLYISLIFSERGDETSSEKVLTQIQLYWSQPEGE